MTSPEAKKAFRVDDNTDIYGRYNILKRVDNGETVARVYEFLAADTKVTKP